MCVCTHAKVRTGEGGDHCGSWFSPSTAWVPSLELRSSGLVASTFTYLWLALGSPWLLLQIDSADRPINDALNSRNTFVPSSRD